MKPKDITIQPLLDSRHGLCPGCGSATAMAHILSIVTSPLPSGKTKRIRSAVIPASCWSIGSGWGGASFIGTNLVNTPFIAGATVGEGISIMSERAGLADDELTIVWAGDGASFDIGLGLLSGAAIRNADILYVINDNQTYGNTGAQESGATPEGAKTQTSPRGKEIAQKDILGIMLSHKIPYFASLALGVTTLDDFYAKVRKAADTKGFRCLHVLSVCPPGWKCDTSSAPELAQLAVETRIFPLVEVIDGRLCLMRPKREKPAEEFLKRQRRFSPVLDSPEALKEFQERVDKRWRYLSDLEKMGGAV
ncbi:MAG: thiamine pyrophosphate-dependent enzyme [Candidatus Sungiibacteriota bacterium]